MKECIFCKIVKGEIDSAKIWENKEFLAILDANPNTKGMTVAGAKPINSLGFTFVTIVFSIFFSSVLVFSLLGFIQGATPLILIIALLSLFIILDLICPRIMSYLRYERNLPKKRP